MPYETPLTKVLRGGASRVRSPASLEDDDNLDYQAPGVLSEIGTTALSGIARVGNVLDIPGSMVRDVLGGQNPLDQLLPWNWTTDENRLSGRDLLRQYGMVGKDDTYGNFWGGVASEILLDPTTYLSFGASAATKGGKLLQAAGKLDDVAKVAKTTKRAGMISTKVGDVVESLDRAGREAVQATADRMKINLDEVADQPVRSLMRASIPFTDMGVNIGTGEIAQKIAGAIDYTLNPSLAEDYLGEAIRASRVPVQAADEAADATGMITQQAARDATSLSGAVDNVSVAPLPEFADTATTKLLQMAQYPVSAAASAQRFARGLFDPSVGGQFTKTGQMAEEAKYKRSIQLQEQARDSLKELIEPIDAIETAFKDHFGRHIIDTEMRKGLPRSLAEAMVGKLTDSFVKMFAETGSVERASEFIGLPMNQVPSNVLEPMLDVANKISINEFKLHGIKKAMGIREGFVDSVQGDIYQATRGDELTAPGAAGASTDAGYFFRSRSIGRGTTGIVDAIRGAFNILGTRTASSMGRREVIAQVPSEVVNKLLVDDGIRKSTTQKLVNGNWTTVDTRGGKTTVEYVLDKYGDYLGKGTVDVLDEATGQMKKVPKWTKEEHARQLVDWVKHHEQFPMFNRTLFSDHQRYMLDGAKKVASTESIYELLKGSAIDNALDTDIKIKDVIKRLDLEEDIALGYFADKVGKSIEEAAEMGVSEDVANAVIAMGKTGNKPWMEAITSVVDAVTESFKRNVTLPFPAFSSRNLTGGQFVNLVSGMIRDFRDIGDYKWGVEEAQKLYKTGDREFLKEIYQLDVIDPRALSEGVRASDDVPKFGYVGNPLNVRETYGQVGLNVSENPLFESARMNAVADPVRKAYGTVMKTGEKASGYVEYMNRVPMYLYLTRKKGWDPAAAAAKVKELQLDYTALATFEKDVMRRLVPFYSFSRRMAPFLLGRIQEAPGGALAQTVRLSREAANPDPSTPEWVSSTLSVPNPFKTPEPGGASYITGFGLPFENLTSFFEGPRAAGREALSQTNPLVKAPLEYFTNQSFFQSGPSGAGRPLDDLDPVLGRTVANIKERITGQRERRANYFPAALEFAVSNSPLSRYASTARQLTDPRKNLWDIATNTLTGARVTDISPAARDAVLRDRSIELMKRLGSSSFSRAYFPEDVIAGMGSGELALAEELQALQNILAQRSKARKEARTQPQPR